MFRAFFIEVVSRSESEINKFRQSMRISVLGGDIPAPICTFENMPFRPDQSNLKETILRNIEKSGILYVFQIIQRIQRADSHSDAVDSDYHSEPRFIGNRSDRLWKNRGVSSSAFTAFEYA